MFSICKNKKIKIEEFKDKSDKIILQLIDYSGSLCSEIKLNSII